MTNNTSSVLNREHKAIRLLLFINAFLIIFYFTAIYTLKIPIDEKTMFSTLDSKEYLSASSEFYKLSEQGTSFTRPFLYPLLVLLTYKTLGVYSLWFLQFCFWLLSINFIFFTTLKLTKKISLSIVSILLLAFNLSYLSLTLHCLTEVIVLFLLSYTLYFISSNLQRVDSIPVINRCLFILTLLSVVKPLFFIVFLLLLAIHLCRHRKEIYSTKNSIKLLLVLIPVFFQISIMKAKYDTFAFSKIGSLTFKRYLLAQGLYLNDLKPLYDSIAWQDYVYKAEAFSNKKAFHYISDNKTLYLKLYLKNIKGNIDAYPSYLILGDRYLYKFFIKYMRAVNFIYFCLHIAFLIPSIAVLLILYRQKRYKDFIFIGSLILLLYYILLTSGISFWADDRLVLPSLPLWIVLYLFIYHQGVVLIALRKPLEETRRRQIN